MNRLRYELRWWLMPRVAHETARHRADHLAPWTVFNRQLIEVARAFSEGLVPLFRQFAAAAQPVADTLRDLAPLVEAATKENR